MIEEFGMRVVVLLLVIATGTNAFGDCNNATVSFLFALDASSGDIQWMNASVTDVAVPLATKIQMPPAGCTTVSAAFFAERVRVLPRPGTF